MDNMRNSNKRAIILDDQRGIRLPLEILLSRSGYNVVPYGSPTEATIFNQPHNCPLASGHEEQFDTSPVCADLIITDVDMPGISGMEYVRTIRQAGCRVRYIAMMSGNWKTKDLLEAEALGCKCFTKPFRLQEMKEWLSTLDY